MDLSLATKTVAKPSVRQCQEGQRYELENTDWECSYNCSFTWKIPEIQQKRAAGNVLYSPPFYTGQNGGRGYKMCLFLYMDGDGSGKGTHLSFFFTLMRGEYDALLTWPFRQNVALILQDQDQQKHIAKWFQPDLSDAADSFQRPSPNSDMNVASGCPEFVPLSIMDNPSYVKNGAMIFSCTVDTTEANH